MKCKYSRWICGIIAFFILFSGMCVEQSKADSLFVCVENRPYTFFKSSSEFTRSRHELSGSELMGNRNISFVSGNTRKTAMRFWGRLSMRLHPAGKLMAGLSNVQVAAEVTGVSETYYFSVLLHFIQNKDGKK